MCTFEGDASLRTVWKPVRLTKPSSKDWDERKWNASNRKTGDKRRSTNFGIVQSQSNIKRVIFVKLRRMSQWVSWNFSLITSHTYLECKRLTVVYKINAIIALRALHLCRGSFIVDQLPVRWAVDVRERFCKTTIFRLYMANDAFHKVSCANAGVAASDLKKQHVQIPASASPAFIDMDIYSEILYTNNGHVFVIVMTDKY